MAEYPLAVAYDYVWRELCVLRWELNAPHKTKIHVHYPRGAAHPDGDMQKEITRLLEAAKEWVDYFGNDGAICPPEDMPTINHVIPFTVSKHTIHPTWNGNRRVAKKVEYPDGTQFFVPERDRSSQTDRFEECLRHDRFIYSRALLEEPALRPADLLAESRVIKTTLLPAP